jgi:hypothetical protein
VELDANLQSPAIKEKSIYGESVKKSQSPSPSVPAKTFEDKLGGGQNSQKTPDSRLRGNDEKWQAMTFYKKNQVFDVGKIKVCF